MGLCCFCTVTSTLDVYFAVYVHDKRQNVLHWHEGNQEKPELLRGLLAYGLPGLTLFKLCTF
jgi:hypothetical protein